MNSNSAESQPTLATYLIGFGLALFLTFLAFGVVESKTLSRGLTIAAVSALAVVQILIHLHYFLHLSFRPRRNHRLITLVFALFIIFIMVGGTFWIMHDLDAQMSPK